MTLFFRKAREESTGNEHQTDHNPNWMLNRNEPPTLRCSPSQVPPVSQPPHHNPYPSHNQEGYPAEPYTPYAPSHPPHFSPQQHSGHFQGHPPQPQGQRQAFSYGSAPENPGYSPNFPPSYPEAPPQTQTIHAGQGRATFGDASTPLGYSNTPHPHNPNQQIRQMGFLQENFREDKQEKHTVDENDWNDRQSPLNFVILSGLVMTLTVLGWFTYRWMATDYSGEPPVITAEDHPFKVKPETPGGLVVPHQDKLVYGRLTPDTQQPVEHLLPQPEQPVALTQPAQPEYAAPYGNDASHPSGPHQPQQTPYSPSGYYSHPPHPGQGEGYGYQQPEPMAYPPESHKHAPVTQHPNHQIPQPRYAQEVPPYPDAYQGSNSSERNPGIDPYQQQNVPQGAQGGTGYAPPPQQHPMAYPQAPQGVPQGSPQGSYQQQAFAPSGGAYADARSPYSAPPSHGPSSPPLPDSRSASGPAQHGLHRNHHDPISSRKDTLPKEGIDEDMQANEALDHLLADEISGRAPAPSPASSKKENKPQAIPSDAFYLQVASFDNDGDAKNEIRRLRALDSALFKDRKFVLQKSESSTTKKRIFKVLVGFFPTANAATQFKTKLKAHKVDGFVVKSKVPSKKV